MSKLRPNEPPLLAAIFLDLFGFGMVIPDLQLRAEGMGAPGWLIGVILASTFLIQTIFSTPWGMLSDRIGRKSVFVACTSISALSMVVYGLAPSVWIILLSRVIAGFGAANVAAAQAAIADLYDGEVRTAALGRLSAAMTTGLIAGPAAGGFIGEHLGSDRLGLIGAGASLIGVLLVVFFAKMPPGHVEGKKFSFGGFSLLKDVPKLVPLAIAMITAWFSLAMLEGTFGRLLEHILKLEDGRDEFGMIFAFESVIGVIVQAFLIGWLMRRFSPRWLLISAYMLQGLGLALSPFAPMLGILFVFSGIYAFGSAVANPVVNGLASGIVPKSQQGELFGMLQSARGVGFIIGPIIGGAVFDYEPGLPYWIAGLACLASAILIMKADLPDAPQAEPA